MNKNYARFLTCLFCAFLAVIFVANALTPDKDFSQVENRTLAQKPAFKIGTASGGFKDGNLFSGKFMSDYETYVTDQFVLRDVWVAAKAYAERAVGKKENNNVYFCADSTLISRFDTPNERRVNTNIKAVDRLVGNTDVPVYFGLIPTQACVWADKLPEGAPNHDQKLIIDQAAQASSAKPVDLYTTLMAHKGEAVFYRTDHHWTSLGAYYGYTALAGALGYEALPLSSYQKTTVSTEFYGTVFSTSGVRWVKPDVMDTYVPEDGISVVSLTYDKNWNLLSETPRELYVESFLDVKDKYSMFLGGQQSLGVVTTPNTDKPKLLLVRDSYSDSLVPFLTPHYSEIHLIDMRYFKLSVSEYIANNGIDQVLVLYSVPNFVGDVDIALMK